MLLHEIVKRGYIDDIAIVEQDRRITYKELSETISSTRNKLYEIGIRQGERVAIFSKNRAEFIYIYYAIISIGAISVPINYQLNPKEIAYIIEDAGIKHIFTDTLIALDDDLNVIQHNIMEKYISNVPAPELPVDFNGDNPCVIIYTSGTTGKPKGAMSSHNNLIKNAEMMSGIGCKRGDRVLCILPMYHCFSWNCSVSYTLYCGAEIVILENFILKEAIEVIKREKITDVYFVPSICSLMLKLVEAEEISTLKMIASAGAPLSLKIANDFFDKFGLPINELYGLTEVAPVTLNPLGEVRAGSVGKLVPDIEVRLIDSNGEDVPTYREGELIVRGDNVMLGYWNRPEETTKVIDSDGWFHTGDVARIDIDGYVYIVDRIKEMIISSGENIYPREVEEVIYRFPGIKDVAVVGIDDEARGQVAICFYSTQENVEIDMKELKYFMKNNLALYKIPREFHKLKELPRTSTGKISKHQILEDFF